MASTAHSTLQDRTDYLPTEAQALRRCIAEVYEECFSLSKKAEAEGQRKRQAADGVSIWNLVDLYPDDIRGYAQYAQLRVPVRYPPEAVPHLRQCALFELPGVLDWFTTTSQERPHMRHYLETVDYLRLQVIDYIQRFDHLTVDQKSF